MFIKSLFNVFILTSLGSLILLNPVETFRQTERQDKPEKKTKTIDINPNYAKAYNNRGNTYYSLKQHNEAIADYTKAIEINPQFALAYYNRGQAYFQLGNLQQAQQNWQQANLIFQ